LKKGSSYSLKVANNNPTASAQPETVELLNPSNLSTSTTAEEQEV
jgi:hypothetical protein